jgi:cell wall-associated NlpC family hydrolase
VRWLILTLLSVFLAVGLGLSVTLSVYAQAAADQDAAEGAVQQESTTQESSFEALALEVSRTGGFVSQGSVPGAHAPAEVIEAMEPPELYTQVVDNASPGRFRAPGWQNESSNPDGYGKDYTVTEPSERTRSAQFKVKIPADDYYTVYAWWPAEAGNNAATRFGVGTASGVKWTEVDQRRDGGFWVRIGAYQMEAGDRVVQAAPGSGSKGYAVADAVQVVRGAQVAPPDASYEEPAGGEGELTMAASRREGRQIVRVARRHIGTPYRLSPPNPCRAYRSEDCSCLTKLVFRKFGRRLPDNPVKQWKYGRRIAKSNLRPGDLVFFKENGRRNPITHNGIYSGRGYLVHASSYFGKVVESKMKYIRGYYGAKRLRV